LNVITDLISEVLSSDRYSSSSQGISEIFLS
jgi:hypothetical protein